MNTKSIVVLVAFVAWSGICWAWYVLGIKGKYNTDTAHVAKQDTLVKDTINLPNLLPMDTLKSVQILEQKTILYFKKDSVDFEQDTLIKNYLTKLSQRLIILKDTVITIVGHSHGLATAQDNLVRSYKNAEAVQTYMLSKGAPISKIKFEGLGSKETLLKDSTEEARYKNRRIEIFFNKKPQ